MRFFTVLFVLFLVINCTYSQSFEFRVDTLSDNVHPDELENYISNFAVNVSNEAKTLRWTQKTIFKGSKWSNSQGLRMPKDIMDSLDLQVGDNVNITMLDGKVIIEPIKKNILNYDSNELISKIPTYYKANEEFDTIVGKEEW